MSTLAQTHFALHAAPADVYQVCRIVVYGYQISEMSRYCPTCSNERGDPSLWPATCNCKPRYVVVGSSRNDFVYRRAVCVAEHCGVPLVVQGGHESWAS